MTAEQNTEALKKARAFSDNKDKIDGFYNGYVQATLELQKQIQIDAEHIIVLQKQNGELTDKVKELEAQNLQLLKEWRVMDKAKQKAELKVAELIGDVSTLEQDCKRLEAQIEQTKCCENCLYQGECDLSGYEECKNFDKWELRR